MGEAEPRLLIVDDEESLLENLARAATARGYRAATARSGQEAWAFLTRERFDLVVTDLRMPGVDGPELMERLQGSRAPPLVIVITGYATLEAAVDCLRKGAVDFLVKPFEVETFLGSVAKALAKHSSRPGETDWDEIAARYRLTRRQRQILERFHATGMGNRELAQEFSLSPNTVKTHLTNAFQKLGVSSRTQLLQKLTQKH